MNANELADALDDVVANYIQMIADVDFSDVATMLRQQQAEIEALKQIIDANNLNQNIGQFVKPTNEPAAWMHQNPDYAISKHQSLEYNIPLYTHPVKELHLSLQKSKQTGELLAVTYTDDEHRIVEVLWQKPPVKELTDEEIEQVWTEVTCQELNVPYSFARAILRKAQEKCTK